MIDVRIVNISLTCSESSFKRNVSCESSKLFSIDFSIFNLRCEIFFDSNKEEFRGKRLNEEEEEEEEDRNEIDLMKKRRIERINPQKN